MTMVHDLLTEPLLSWRDTGRQRGMTTLPGLLEKLGSGELGDFPKVRTHQFHPWVMFLTQLAAIALHRAGRTEPNTSEAEWREMLLKLTGGAHEPWCLVVEDLSKPAFFQPPVPEAKREGFSLAEEWKVVEQPDEIDVLVLSKAHDVKASRLRNILPESWAYALTTLQTMQGYPGRGYTGVARMKGGYGSRARIGLGASHSVGSRFQRDVAVLLDTWPLLLDRGYRDDGLGLVWVEPWDGKLSLAAGALCPHFIEICWRTRLVLSGTAMHCAYTTTENRRCMPEIKSGDVGDPWIPIERKDGGALTLGGRGFHYELLTRLLLTDEYEPAAAQRPREGDGDPVFLLGSALVRGQGKTEGLHEYALSIPGAVKRRLGNHDGRAALGRRAELFVQRAKQMRSHVLFPALNQLALGENLVDDRFDARVDEVFFENLFGTLERDDDAARLSWEQRLETHAWDELHQAIGRCCVPDARRYRAIAAAESMFRGCLHKHFPDVYKAESAAREPSNEGAQP